jgi:uncharacterized membrane protein YjjB (DUF3815 family)
MDLLTLLSAAFWAGIMAAALSVIFTVPPGELVLPFAGGMTGVIVRTLATAAGLPLVPSTLVAAAVISLMAIGFSRRRTSAPVIALAAMLPIGPASQALNMTTGLMQILTATDQATLLGLVTQVSADLITTIAVAAALAVGFIAPLLVLRAKGEG